MYKTNSFRFVISLLCVTLFIVPQAVWSGVSDIEEMSANSWMEIPNTHLSSVAADPSQYPFLTRSTSSINNILDYSGAAFDTTRNRLVVWGGGHNSYDGNELYAYDVDTSTWHRLTEPSQPNLCGQVNSDGTPNSRHTYNGLAYIEHADRFFGLGGALACGPGSCGADITWTFNFASRQWENRNPSGSLPRTMCENIAAYDPETKKVWWFDGNSSNTSGLYSYDYSMNQWTRHASDVYYVRRTAVVDTKRGLLIVIGKGEVVAYDIRNGNYAKQVWNTSGGANLIGKEKPGVAYDPATDRIVGWAGGSVYALNPDTKVWTAYSAPGAPSTYKLVGIYGLWRYVPSVNAFIVVTSPNANVHFYKFSTGGGAPTPSVDTMPPSAPTNLQGSSVSSQ